MSFGTRTVHDFMHYRLYSLIRPKIKETTFSNYKNILDKWIRHWLNEKKLERLTKEEVQQFVNVLKDNKLRLLA